MIGYRSGRLVKILLPLLYYGIYVLVDAIFFSEAIFNCFSQGNKINCGTNTMWYVIFVALAGIFVFATLNLFCSRGLQKTSNVTTILKFIPLGLVILTGIIFGCINKDQNLFANDSITTIDGTEYSGKFSFTGMLDSLPAIFFAFDSFLIIGNIAGEMKNPNKNIPLSIVVSMIVAGILYLLVTIGQICVGCGSAYAVFDFIFATNVTAKTAFHYIISIFIFISIFGVLNSMTMGAIRSFDSAVEEEIIVGSK
ncbi:MAG: amino acid permease [Mycoplasmoidaceae bacterium]|nr:amino acid permease [Mycoplasmoidaceae bacterium]